MRKRAVAVSPRLALFAVIVGTLCFQGCKESPTQSPEAAASGDSPNNLLFVEASEEAGLHFIHDAGIQGEYFMPESVGSGAAVFDLDNDGRLDIYLIQNGGTNSHSRNQLFRQSEAGRFLNASAGSGLDVTGWGMGAAVGDLNNDGLAELLLTEYGAARLFLNLGGGQFREITQPAGLDNPRWATAASFLDFDRDGWLDLVVGNYVDYIPTQKCLDAAGILEYCGPHNFEGTAARLYRNRSRSGAVVFEDVTVSSGLARSKGPTLGILCADFDGDRWPDIFFSDDGAPNRLFMNQRDGTFREEAVLRGVAFDAMGKTAGNMGVGVGDVNADGLLDLFVTHLSHEQHALWVQGPRGFYQDQIAAFGLANPAWRGTGFGAVLMDFNIDGYLDLAFVNGLVRRGHDPAPRLAGLHPSLSPYAQRYQVFLGLQTGRFQEVSEANPSFSGHAAVGRGLAYGDIDNDGDVDLLAISAGGPARLFKNVAPRRGHWLGVRAIDPAYGGRDAIGAEVFFQAGGRVWWGLVQTASSYLSSNDPRVFFGLGGQSQIDSISVVWPDGNEELFHSNAVDQHVTLRKGAGEPR